ncbi:P-loop NTPase fold protein [Rhizobium sp. S152]|uniref:KAP family P-loop NTPase fold protein n=1 Tax=Rhizobium sp. S152 TaxID=3055038 RepID=UPI0025A96906|nr:P-loop NTPase fold protein [Rhizobium sp. S152]MDM9627606.1 P-loop NTPase fold protein [Rhizobium sp. S152]
MPHTNLDTDRPLSDEKADRFGFVGIAERLAPSILEAVKGDGMVIGLEGPWGSGKTTLLNFLEAELEKGKDKKTHIIKIAPWLNGDVSNLVSSLLDPIAEVIEKFEEAQLGRKSIWKKAKKKGGEFGELVRNYGARTGRVLAPAARFAEYLLPGAKAGADALELSSEYLEKLGRNPTTAEVKAKISEKIAELDIGFVVILDDLDRLEPSQAVEVVRLVRSVADFPGLVYILCYDRDVLAHALQVGLSVPDGDAFLQKIIQLTFNIPLPEPFDLRHSFLADAVEIYKEVTGATEIDKDLYSDLRSAVDREGGGLRTPREVKLALNAIRFCYAGIKDDVFFPDLCRLNLIKVTNTPLYRWLEEYLGTRSVVVTGDGMVTDEEKIQMGTRLLDLLPSDDATSTRSIWSLRQFIPGVVKADTPSKRVFEQAGQNETNEAITGKRLGSPIHYRFYFALTSPKTVMAQDAFRNLIVLAGSDVEKLTKELIRLGTERRASGLTWLEHALDRMDTATVNTLSVPETVGLVKAIAGAADRISSINNETRPFSVSIEAQAENVVVDCLWRLKKKDAVAFNDLATWLAKDCQSISWLVGKFFRTQLVSHGVVEGRGQPPESRLFDDHQFQRLMAVLKKRTADPATKAAISDLPRLAAYVWGWSELTSKQTVRRWATGFVKTDENFLYFLNALRSWSMSDKVYYPLQKDAVTAWLPWDKTVARLEELHARGVEEAATLIEAIRIGRR